MEAFTNDAQPSLAPELKSVVVNIQVVTLAKASNVELQANKPVTVSDCKTTVLNTQNLVQNTSAINLNQPANCFSLADEVVTKTENVNVSVANLPKDLRPIVVVGHKTAIVSEVYTNGQRENKTPTVPELSFSVLTVLAFAFYRKVKESKNNFETKIYNIFSLNRFEVLRC